LNSGSRRPQIKSPNELAAAGIEVLAPKQQTAPVVFTSPHSGRNYPDSFITNTRLELRTLRRSEDAFVDEAFTSAPEFGAPLLRAHFPRAYVDANRQAWELDAKMFNAPLPDYVTTRSPRISAGLGTIPRIVANGEQIYDKLLNFDEVRERIDMHYQPYHQSLAYLIRKTVDGFGGCLIVDCHSMPSGNGFDGSRKITGPKLADIILGSCHGKSCAPEIVELATSVCRNMGLSVTHNKPYAGGFTTRHYGKPANGVHALQIEINRALYMDEQRIERGPGLAQLVRQFRRLIDALTSIDTALLQSHQLKAAE